ncbi:PIR protein [Plasmodium vivax]|nr:PIR protein [Plasmodium vivax]
MQETDLLSDLPSYKFYSGFDNDKSHTGYSIQCDNVSKDQSEQQEFSTICTKLSKNIYHLENEVPQDPSFFEKHCYGLNYWLYVQVTNVLVKGENKNNIYPFFEKIQNNWAMIERKGKPGDNKKKCMPESKLFKTGLYEHFKQLLDYFENYEQIKEEISKPSEQSHKYCPYIVKRLSLYFTLKELCSRIEDENCNKYKQDFEKYDPSKLLSYLACSEENTYKISVDQTLVTKMLSLNQPNFDSLLQSFGVSNLANLQGVFTDSIYNLISSGLGGTGIQGIFDKIPYFSNIFNYDIMQKYVMPALYGLGGLIFFFVLYKCRGCLPCCCIFRRRKKKRKHLSDFDTSGLMNTPLGFPAPMMPINPYGLRYQPF